MKTLVCISHLRWDFVWQRPQHLLARLAKQYRVIFVEEPVISTTEKTPRLDVSTRDLLNGGTVTVVRLIQPAAQDRWIGHGDTLTQSAYSQLLRGYLHANSIYQPILWLYTPMACDFTHTIDHGVLIVDVMDQLSAFKGAPAALRQNEAHVLPKADIVFTGGVSLYRDKRPLNANTHVFPSGVEIEHFAKAAQRENFAPPAPLDQLSSPVLGYFGVIDERMDLNLLAAVAKARPKWNIVLVGPVVKIDPAELPQAPNLHYPGMRRYDELPAYLAYFDVALVPFALNDATRYLSPTKTLEYMAAHKPIVSTPIVDVIELYSDVVRIADTPAAFIQQVEAALRENGAARKAREDALLRSQTWDTIAERMTAIIRKAENPHVTRTRPPAALTTPTTPITATTRAAIFNE